MTKSCVECAKDGSPYKCPQCLAFYCSLPCSRQHRDKCVQLRVDPSTETSEDMKKDSSESSCVPVEENTKIKEFLEQNTYLRTHIPILLARISRSHAQVDTKPDSSLAKDLERQSRTCEILKETLEVDPNVVLLYELLQQEGYI